MGTWSQTNGSSLSFQKSPFYEVTFLGTVHNINLGGSLSRDPDVQLIDRVEEAQIEGKINLLPKLEDKMLMTVSKYGVKVMDMQKNEVLQRHPLHTVAQIVYYVDSFLKSNVALKIGQFGRGVFDCFIFQCQNESQAHDICQSVKDVFSSISHHAHMSTL